MKLYIKFVKRFFLGTETKKFAAFVISHVYNETHPGSLADEYFFNQKSVGVFTFLRMSLAFLLFSTNLDSKLQTRIFQEVLTRKEATELRLIMNHILKDSEINL